ncbi:MAG: recombinase [uncultured bacterium]|uniref:Resolvase/invertase-type recombinase catalytic domain-containing protein n=1 Tax=Candidatus Daviesbacteria bacterium RIFCSPHIGHO2_01_FULL_40_11 TaxID=1797762 RepID=A0A1F5JI85_9BACT|nr:MAG: recombinase [uncultured bacterium]OGE28299.1 MAG: hypothetical protein A2867_04760 [Candidatus Daviesbacteria bacterium RIFCSPHIGHO2_01_FULL_40_11]
MKKAFGYIRVSTVGQAEEGFSLDHQKEAIKDYCRTREMQLLQVFVDEGKSGRTVNRPEFQEMLKQIKEKGIDCVLIYKIDRFARNVTDFSRIWNEFKESGINLISLLEGDLSNGSSLVPNIFASVAQWESEVNGQRTKDALMEKFRSGWQPTCPPIGYRSVGGDGERKYCEPDPYAAPIIKKMFELYSTGQYSMMTLQEWLQDKNIISKNGTIISFSRINNILNNPFYYGLIRWHGQEKTGKHTPLISKQLFETCQYILKKHRHFLVRERKFDFLLRGFAYCSCGMRLVGEHHIIRSNKKRISYYHCQTRYSPDCKQKYVQVKDLEEQVENYIKEIEFTDEFIAQVKQQANDFLNTGRQNTDGMRQALINQKTGLEVKRKRVEDLLVDGGIDQETYNRKHPEITQQINNLQIQIDEVEEESKLDMPLIAETLFLTKNIYKTYQSAPDPLKRHYLRFFYEGFTVDNKVIIEAKPTPIFEALKTANMVKLRQVQLPSISLTNSLVQVIKTFQNPVWAEQIRERLKQINTLTKVAAI